MQLKMSLDLTLSRADHYQRVAKGGERPPLDHKIPAALHNLLQHTWDADVMGEAKLELNRVREELGFSLAPTTPKKHLRRNSSNMDFLLYNNGNGEAAVSMTADDFENYFAGCGQ